MSKRPPLPTCAALACIFAVMLYFISICPYMTDNFVFSHAIKPGYAQFFAGAAITVAPITFASAFQMAAEMYSTWCGRFAGNLMVYLLFMLPHWLYAILAAATFCFYLLLLLACVFGRSWRKHITPGWLLALAALLWLGLPSFGSAFFWLSVGGQIALLGQAAIFLPMRFALDSPPACQANNRPTSAQTRPTWRLLLASSLYLLAGIFAASLDYPTSAALPPTALLCAAWLFYSKKRQLAALVFAGAIGLCIGAALTLLAPGNAARLQITDAPEVHAFLAAAWGQRILAWLQNLPAALAMQYLTLLPLLLGVIGLEQKHGRSWFRHIPMSAWLFLLPCAFTHGSYLFTAWPPPRAFATSYVQLLLAGCIIYAAGQPLISAWARKAQLVGKCLLALACIFSIVHQAQRFWLAHAADKQREAVFAASQGGQAEAPPYPVRGDHYFLIGKDLPDISHDPAHWTSRAVAAHYGLKSVRLKKPPVADFTFSGPKLRNLALRIDGKYLEAACANAANAPDELHVYYYGHPALLAILPAPLADAVYSWLAKGQKNDWRLKLVPLLLARADLDLKNVGSGGVQGKAELPGLWSNRAIWLTQPGAGKFSFAVLPLKEKTALFPGQAQ